MRAPYFQDSHTTVYQGDAREVLQGLPERSAQCVVTSPPYWGLRDYKTPGQIGLEKSVDEYVSVMVDVFREVRRVLRDDGTVWLNLGDSYNSNAGGYYPDGEFDRPSRSEQRWRNNKAVASLKPKDLCGIPWAVAFALRADGWWLRSDIVWSKLNPMPESVRDRPTRSHEYVFLLSKKSAYYYDADAIREPTPLQSVKMPDGWDTGDGAHGTIHRNGREAGRPKNAEISGRNKRTVWEIATQPYPDAHFATFPEALVRPCILAGTSERGACACGAPWERVTETTHRLLQTTNNKRKVDEAFTHYAEMPRMNKETTTTGWRPTCNHGVSDDGEEGRERVGAAVRRGFSDDAPASPSSPVPCTVLDPFAGSGTTALVARKAGRKAILIELSDEYCRLIVDRIGQGVLL